MAQQSSRRKAGARPPGTTAAAYRQVLAETPAVVEAEAHAATLAARAAERGEAGLRLDGYRLRRRWSALSAAEKRLLAEIEEELRELEDGHGIELVDVIDQATGLATHLFVLWPFGSGVLVDRTRRAVVADVVQHWFDVRGDHALRERMAVAWARSSAALGIAEHVSFAPRTVESTSASATPAGAPASTSKPIVDPPPADGPPADGPPDPLDTPVTLEGTRVPAWRVLSDAIRGVRSDADVAADLATLPSETLAAIWTALARPRPNGRLADVQAPRPKGAQSGSPVALGAHAERVVRLANAISERLDDAGERAARAILHERADWVERWGPRVAQGAQLSVPHTFELAAALGALARRARVGGGALDPSFDLLLETLAGSLAASYPLAVVLEDLPPPRAATIARAQLELMERFPSAESGDAAIRVLEAWGGGPFYEAIFLRVIAAIGVPARVSLEAAIARGSAQKKALSRALTALAKTARRRGRGGCTR